MRPRDNTVAVLEESMELTKRFSFNPKLGIDNPAMTADDTEPASDLSLRVCVLKRVNGETFGFQLKVEKGKQGHIIRQLESQGVGKRSGLKDGDRLLEVNEMFVDNLGHKEVILHDLQWSHIASFATHLFCYHVSKGRDLKELAIVNRGEGWRPPRLCHITRGAASGLGLNILPIEGEKGKFMMSPVKGGAAEKAGVKKGERLVWINGAMASELTHSAISKMVKKSKDHVTVLVIDSESEKSYARRKMPILPAMADAESMPYRPRRLHLVLGPEGYGILLKQEINKAGYSAHRLGEVDKGSPAELGGVKEGELLLEVNGEPTDSLSHEDVVSKIKQSGHQVTLTTMPPQGKEFYTKLGLSPLLFCLDVPPHRPEEKTESPLTPPVEPQKDVQINPDIRLCELQRGSLGFGFNLGCIQQKPGTFISQVTAGGPGGSSGLLQGDVVVEVNGQNMENESVEDVILQVKRGGRSLSLLVVDRRGYEWLKTNGKPITANNVATTPVVEKNAFSAAEPPTDD
nr:NHERF family PDZ scaffold protein 4b [Misgurnus anguillicaudatus]